LTEENVNYVCCGARGRGDRRKGKSEELVRQGLGDEDGASFTSRAVAGGGKGFGGFDRFRQGFGDIKNGG
jgi:hypothetical protein